MSVSVDFESKISDERPLFVSTEESPDAEIDVLLTVDIDIDSEGTGTYNNNAYVGCATTLYGGTRTHADNAITWNASRYDFDCDYQPRVEVTNSVGYVDANTRTFVEELSGSNVGTYADRWEYSSDLTAKLVDGTSLCEPVSGSFLLTYRHNRQGIVRTVTDISKEEDDLYWRVVIKRTQLTYTSGVETESDPTITEFFARQIVMGRIPGENLTTFICDSVDF